MEKNNNNNNKYKKAVSTYVYPYFHIFKRFTMNMLGEVFT